jgi:hypothetical protein
METREFPTAVIASISSGVLLCKFNEMHEAAEYLMGHPIWTHHFASKDLWAAMRGKVLEQCPDMLADDDGSITLNNWQEKLAEAEAKIGTVCVIKKGNGETAAHPLDGPPEGKPVIVLQGSTQPPCDVEN